MGWITGNFGNPKVVPVGALYVQNFPIFGKLKTNCRNIKIR